MPKEVVQRPLKIIDKRQTLDQIFTLCIAYLLSVVNGIGEASKKTYTNGDASVETIGTYVDFKINPETGLPYIEAGLPPIKEGVTSVGGEDLTPTLNDLNQRISELSTKIDTINSTLATIQGEISSINGSITALQTRVTALEAKE